MTTEATLTPAHQRRLARLAHEAHCEPQDLLDDVFRFGCDFVEQDIRETSKAIAALDASKGIPHRRVMAESNAVVDRRVRQGTLDDFIGILQPRRRALSVKAIDAAIAKSLLEKHGRKMQKEKRT